MTRRKPEHVQVDYVQIPWDFVKMHKYVTLAADVHEWLAILGHLIKRNKFGNN